MKKQTIIKTGLVSSIGLTAFVCAAVSPSVFGTGTSGNVQLDTEIATSIAMKIVSPNDVNPDCTPESGVTYGEVNRYASSTGDDSGKMVDTFNGNEGEADEINTNTSCATLSMTPNTFDSTYSDVTVYTNSGTGYAVTLQSAENVSPNLVNVADNTQYIEAGALTEQDGTGEQAGQKVVPGGQNKWAYKTNNGIITDWTAATTSPVAIKSYDTTTSGGDTTRVTYGISAGSNPTGKYTTTLTYTATMFDGANPYVGNVETETVPNLTISPTSLKIARKQTKTLTVTPAEGYYLSDVDCPEGYNCSNYTTDKDDPASAETQNIAIKNESTESGSVSIGLTVSETGPPRCSSSVPYDSECVYGANRTPAMRLRDNKYWVKTPLGQTTWADQYSITCPSEMSRPNAQDFVDLVVAYGAARYPDLGSPYGYYGGTELFYVVTTIGNWTGGQYSGDYVYYWSTDSYDSAYSWGLNIYSRVSGVGGPIAYANKSSNWYIVCYGS